MYAIENYATNTQMLEMQKELMVRNEPNKLPNNQFGQLPNNGDNIDEALEMKGINPDPYNVDQVKDATKEAITAPKVTDEQKDTARMAVVGTEELESAEETAEAYIEMINGLDQEASNDADATDNNAQPNFYQTMADKYRMNDMVDTLGYQNSQTAEQRQLTERFVRTQPVYEQQGLSLQA